MVVPIHDSFAEALPAQRGLAKHKTGTQQEVLQSISPGQCTED